ASTWTNWIGGVKPSGSAIPATPGTVTVTTPTPRRVKATWPDPDDDDTTRWRVVVKKGAATVETGFTRSNRYIYHVPKPDVGQSHLVEVYAISDTGGESAVNTSNPGSPTDDATTQSPPNLPSNPILTFDTQGTRHAKYRAIATAGTSVVDGTHDAPDHYVVQLAHSLTTGASPPVGAKRQHGSVEGDATGDDAAEVFRGIPKTHFVWIRQRARNSGGASAWTAWIGNVKPSGSAIPNDAGTVTATAPTPRRVKATWPEPADDSTVRWRVQVKKGALVVEEGFCRNNRYIYHVPSADTGAVHTVDVYAVSETSNESPVITSNPVVPDPEGDAPTGTIRKVAHAGIPPGWLRCNGQSVLVSTYGALWGVIGYTWG